MAMEQLLELLQDNAQLTPAQLAVMVGKEEGEVKKAIARYEKDGVIKGYHALINWERTEGQKAAASLSYGLRPKRIRALTRLPGAL